MSSVCTRLTIERIGERGEGVASTSDGLVFVPYALAGETIIAGIEGSRGILAEVVFRQPLSPVELDDFDAVVYDPPRAGAESQVRALAASSVPLIAGVSCNAKTFARDAAILCGGGFELSYVQPIDQFRHTPQVEIIACFRRHRPPHPQRKRSLLT